MGNVMGVEMRPGDPNDGKCKCCSRRSMSIWSRGEKRPMPRAASEETIRLHEQRPQGDRGPRAKMQWQEWSVLKARRGTTRPMLREDCARSCRLPAGSVQGRPDRHSCTVEVRQQAQTWVLWNPGCRRGSRCHEKHVRSRTGVQRPLP